MTGPKAFADDGASLSMDPDELAGVVDLFGGLTREELRSAVVDLAARGGEQFDDEALAEAFDTAVEGYYLVPVDAGEEELLVAGPSSLPALPEGGDDLPHLLDVEPRSVDPETAGTAALTRLHGEAARAVHEEDEERIATLLDVCYDVEAWAPVETADLRDRLDAAR